MDAMKTLATLATSIALYGGAVAWGQTAGRGEPKAAPSRGETAPSEMPKVAGDETEIRTFELQHARIVNAMTMLRTILQVRSIAADDNLRMLTVRDRPEVVAAAEELIRRLDRLPDEAEYELEILRVDSGIDVGATLTEDQLASLVGRSDVERILQQRIACTGSRASSITLSTSALCPADARNGAPAIELSVTARQTDASQVRTEIELEAADLLAACGLHFAVRDLDVEAGLETGETHVVGSAQGATEERPAVLLLLTPKKLSSAERLAAEPLRIAGR